MLGSAAPTTQRSTCRSGSGPKSDGPASSHGLRWCAAPNAGRLAAVNVAIQRLRAEIASDRLAFGERTGELRGLEISLAAPSVLAQTAMSLHHAYGAVESILVRVALALEGSLPTAADWHVALLETMALDIEGVRPRVLSPESLTVLRRLIGFRRFFRDAYAVPLDPARLSALREDTATLAPVLAADLDRLDAHLARIAAGAS
jgi:hypothetical protein